MLLWAVLEVTTKPLTIKEHRSNVLLFALLFIIG